MSIYGIGVSKPFPEVEPVMTVDNVPNIYQPSEVKQPNTVVNPSSGILEKVPDIVVPAVPVFDPSSIIRPPNISDTAWKTILSQGEAKYNSQVLAAQQLQEATILAQNKAKAEEAAALLQAAHSGTDAVASATYAEKMNDSIKGNIPAGGAVEIAAMITKATDAAILAASQPDASIEQKAAAELARVSEAEAQAKAAALLLAEKQKVQYETEQTYQALKADPEKTRQANEYQPIMNEANNNLMTAQTNASDTANNEQAVKNEVISSQTVRAYNEANPDSQITKEVITGQSGSAITKSFFEKLIDYIYYTIYANKK
jgi:hypothetical protein